MISRPGACIRRRVRWGRSAVLFALCQLTPSSPAHRMRSARDLPYPSKAVGACRILRLVGGENEAELLAGPVSAANPLLKWPAREVSAGEVSAQFDRDSAVNNAALCEPITAFVDRWHISPDAPDLDAGEFKEKGCVKCNALPLLYGLCLDTYGAGWKAFLCRVCGKDFKKSRLPTVSSARSGGAGTSVSVHGAPTPPQQTAQVADRGQIGERGGLVEKNGVRGLKYRDMYGETLLLLHRRCHLCTRHATYGPAHSSRHEAVHCRAHKTKEEEDLVSRKCLHQGCGKRPMYGNPEDGATPHYCARHRHPGHVDMKNRKCRFGSCQKRASFALAHDARQVPVSCAEHRDSICRSYAARAHADIAGGLRPAECGGDGEGCGLAAEVGKGGAAERIRVVPIWRCNGWTEEGGAARGKAGGKDSGTMCLKRPCYGSDRARTCARHRKPHYSNVYAKFCQHPEGCRRLGQVPCRYSNAR